MAVHHVATPTAKVRAPAHRDMKAMLTGRETDPAVLCVACCSAAGAVCDDTAVRSKEDCTQQHSRSCGTQADLACCRRLDFAKRRATPPGCRCRMVLPSDGETSISLWDAQDPQALHEWLNDNLGGDCTTVLHEVWT